MITAWGPPGVDSRPKTSPVGTVAMVAIGDFARRVGERFGMRYRRAHVLDVTACSWPMAFPWFIPAILASSTTGSGAVSGMPRLGPVEAGIANLHAWALLLVLCFALATGYGRGQPDPAE